MRFQAGALATRCMLQLAVGLAALNVLAIVTHYPTAGLLLGIGLLYRRLKRWRGGGDAYGSARASGLGELWRQGMLGDSGLVLGTCGYLGKPGKAEAVRALFSPLPSAIACRLFFAAFCVGSSGVDMLIRIKDAIMVGLFASTGAGKGVSFLITQLLSQKGSYVVLDPQGSLHDATAEHRRKRFGHRIIRLDSSGVCGPDADGFNPLDFIDPKADDCLDQCRDLASLLVVRTGKEHDPYWNDAAERVLTAFIYFVVTCENDKANRHLLAVRYIVSSRDAYMASVNIMRQGTGLLKQQGDSLSWLADRELNGVLGSVQRHTAWMDSPAVSRALKQSTFDPKELRKNRTTIFVIQPPDRLVTMAPQLRVYLGTLLRVLARGKAREKNPVWFLIDETAALGRMQILESAITTLRGFGIRLFLTFQSPGQLEEVYGEKAQVILDNLNTQIYFAMRSHESCDHISKLIGDMTVDIVTGGESDSSSHPTGNAGQPTPGSRSRSTSFNYSQVARRWATPDEIRTSPDDLAFVFHKGMHVIPVKRLRYYDSPYFTSPILRRRRCGECGGLGLPKLIAAAACLALVLLASSVASRVTAAIDAGQRHAAPGFGGGQAWQPQPVRRAVRYR